MTVMVMHLSCWHWPYCHRPCLNPFQRLDGHQNCLYSHFSIDCLLFASHFGVNSSKTHNPHTSHADRMRTARGHMRAARVRMWTTCGYMRTARGYMRIHHFHQNGHGEHFSWTFVAAIHPGRVADFHCQAGHPSHCSPGLGSPIGSSAR